MKAQVKVEFVLGIVVFAMIIFYVASQISTVFVSINVDTNLDIMKSKSYAIMDILIENTEIGLALEPGILNTTKIDEWNSTNCPEMSKFDMGGYRMIITDDNSEPMLFCGYVGIAPIRINIEQPVKFDNNEYGWISIEMW